MNDAKTLVTARPLDLRIVDTDYRIDLSGLPTVVTIADTLSFPADNALLP